MAVLPPKSAAASKGGSGARFRQRKISVKVALPIYNQKDLVGGDAELEPSQLHHLNASSSQQPRDMHSIETGVDKNEEDEVHLQQVINAAQRVLLGSIKDEKDKKDSSVYIPTPDASKLWKDASKYYNDNSFVEPESYIKFSATVEDTLGVEYNMDEEDEEFFKNVLTKEYPKSNKKTEKKKDSNGDETRPCSEIECEIVLDRFEKTIEEKQPFLSMDPSNLLPYSELSAYILEEFNSKGNKEYPYLQPGPNLNYMSTSTLKENLSKELNYDPFITLFDKNPRDTSSLLKTRPIPLLMQLFGQAIYDHWKKRKIERKGKQITPQLKFEDPNANEKDNDNDPYICFRRREFRQARKTRRADNLGAERIRLLQKSLRKARDLVFNVCKRELLKLDYWNSEYEVFKTRCETKNVKRIAGIKGDDHLFYPHKRRKLPKIETEEDEYDTPTTKIRKERKKASEMEPSTSLSSKEKQVASQAQPEASTNQPYVKLPPSKIPDLDLVTVNLVLKEKNETIKRAVLEKLRKRKEHDRGYVNITYDPYQPFFNLTTNDLNPHLELSHIPYSSIAASNYHQVNTTNVISDSLKRLLEDAKKPLPGMKTFKGSNGELVPSKPFPHLQSLLDDHINSKNNSESYIAHLLTSIQNNDFSSYTEGFNKKGCTDDESSKCSAPIFRMRKRQGRVNQQFIDRRGLMRRPDAEIDSWLNDSDLVNESSDEDLMDVDGAKSPDSEASSVTNAYDSKADAIRRLDSRWQFDNDYTETDKGIRSPFSLDPSRLNCISDETQSIRFGSMLLSKSYDLLRESAHQRQLLMQQARMRALQQHQLNNRNHLQSLHQSSPEAQSQDTAKAGAVQGASSIYKKNGGTMGTAVARTPQQLHAIQQFRKQQNQQQLNQAYLAQKRNGGGGSMSPGPYNGNAGTNTQLYNNNAKYTTATMQSGRR